MAGAHGTGGAKGEDLLITFIDAGGLMLMMIGMGMGLIYTYYIIRLYHVTALLTGITLCIFYLVYDLTVSENVKEKIGSALERLEKERFPELSTIEPSIDESKPKDETKVVDNMTKEYDDNKNALNILVDLERERSKVLEEKCNRLTEDLESERLAYKQWWDRVGKRPATEEVRELEEDVRELKEEVRELLEKIEFLEEDLDCERAKIEGLEEDAEKSKVLMEDKDELVKYLQGEVDKYKKLEDVKEEVLSILKCEIAQMRSLAFDMAASSSKQVCCARAGEGELHEKIESLRDLFNQQAVTQGEKTAKLMEHQEALLEFLKKTMSSLYEQADTSNDDEGYEVVGEI